ncbi:MAG: NADH-quinone oxidoreductase subunit NuoE [Clostridia bacterium]|jgi:NADH:ubiquinone oxidoreductase subunit E|nr:NADH-quinone oxidoreductase subunit NuoE [Clostridia bacterium]MBT7121896.1 NADH-quinone oxidoreductase subunit NuoE [Clostridia bacterium]
MIQVDQKLMREELISFIEEQKKKKGPLMPVMQKAQELFGALTIDVQELIASELDIPMSDVYGVATFYSQFSLEPKGEHIVSVCMGTACYVKNIEKIMDKLVDVLGVEPGETTPDNKFTLEPTRCLGCCGLAPVIMVDDQVYGRLAPSDVAGIIVGY